MLYIICICVSIVLLSFEINLFAYPILEPDYVKAGAREIYILVL